MLTSCLECVGVDLAILGDEVDVFVFPLRDVLNAFLPSHHLGTVFQFLLEDDHLICFHVECCVECFFALLVERGAVFRGLIDEFFEGGDSGRSSECDNICIGGDRSVLTGRLRASVGLECRGKVGDDSGQSLELLGEFRCIRRGVRRLVAGYMIVFLWSEWWECVLTNRSLDESTGVEKQQSTSCWYLS